VKAVRRLQPDLLQVGCFETAFHRGRARAAERFGLPAELFDQGVKRWGFHGLAFESVLAAFAKVAPHVASGRVIVSHLDEESGLCAIRAGRSVDTTTGFSTLDGPPAASRCGTLDPGAVLFLLRRMNVDQIETLLERRSGLLGVSGLSGDLRVLLASNDSRASEAVDFFVYRILREIGSLTAALSGLDALVFTGSIGMHSALIRARICRSLAWLGLAVDAGANERHEQCISPLGRSPSVWVIPTDREKLIATHTWRIVSMLPHRLIYPRGGRNDRAVAIN
jgi:acetate kinase